MARTKQAGKQIRKLKKGSGGRIKEEKRIHSTVQLLPTGSTMLNLQMSDNPFGGAQGGKIVNVIGDSGAGKTLLCLTSLAMATLKEKFSEYRLILDDAEEADEFDHEYMFGEELAERLESPDEDEDGEPLNSETVEDFHMNVLRALKDGRPFIYILDSFDSLDSEDDRKRAEEEYKTKEKGKKWDKGSYGMAKPKRSSALLRNIRSKLKESDSYLFIISQTRDNINPVSFAKKTRSGGRALKFYCTHEMWLAVGKAITKDKTIPGTSRKKRIEIGNNVLIKVSKNKLTGKKGQIEFPVYWDIGIDDITSCANFLLQEGHWKKAKQTINAHDFDVKGTLQTIVSHIEENNLEKELSEICGVVWQEMYEAMKIKNRKRRF